MNRGNAPNAPTTESGAYRLVATVVGFGVVPVRVPPRRCTAKTRRSE